MDSRGTLTRPRGRETLGRARARVSRPLLRYVSVEVLKVFAFVLLLIELAYALFFAAVVARRLDLDFLLVLPLSWSVVLSMLNDSVPLALLFASGLVYGRLVADREVIALKSLGVSPFHLVLPVILIGALSGVFGHFINGFLAPEMNYQKGNVGTLLGTQLRYLGEGYDRDFRVGDQHSLWILHYNGRHLEGIFLGPADANSPGSLLPENVAREIDPVSDPVYLWAERGEILFPEDVQRAWQEKAIAAREEGVPEDEIPERPPPGMFLFRLYDVVGFFSAQIFEPGEPTDFSQRFDLRWLDFPFDPSAMARNRKPKQLTYPKLLEEIERQESGNVGPEGRNPERLEELLVEYYWRHARTASFVIYPVLAAIMALFLNAENRYLPFFASCIIVPAIFYGLGAVGHVLADSGYPAWLTMNGGVIVLVVLAAGGFFFLERKLFR